MTGPSGPPAGEPTTGEACEVCGSPDVRWVKCKLVCANCRTILKTCADS